MRLHRSLAGSWQFQLDPEGLVRVDHLTPDRAIQVPLPWQVAFPELETYSGYAWYVRDIDLDEAGCGARWQHFYRSRSRLKFQYLPERLQF